MGSGWCCACLIRSDSSPRDSMGASTMQRSDGKARGCGRLMPLEPCFTWKAAKGRPAKCCTSSFDRILWLIDPRDVTVRLPVLASLEVSRNRLARAIIANEPYMYRLGRFAGVLAASVFAALLFSPATAGGGEKQKNPVTI